MCVEISSIRKTEVCFHIDNNVCCGTLRVLGVCRWYDSLNIHGGLDFVNVTLYQDADKSLARPGRKQATATRL